MTGSAGTHGRRRGGAELERPLIRQQRSCRLAITRLNVARDLARQRRHVLDAANPLVDIAVDGLAAEADLDRAVVEPFKRDSALRIPLHADRARALALLPRLVGLVDL